MAILLGVLLPAITSARRESTSTARLASQRLLMVGVGAYASDYKDAYPYFATPGFPERWLHAWGRLYTNRSYFGGQSEHWPTLLWPAYIDDTGDDRRGTKAPGPFPELDAANHPMKLVETLFRMTATAFAHPDYWVGESPPTDLALLKGTRHSDVRHTSSKGILLDVGTWRFDSKEDDLAGNLSFALADGSAGRRYLQLVDPQWVVGRPFGSVPWRVIATRGGLAASDF